MTAIVIAKRNPANECAMPKWKPVIDQGRYVVTLRGVDEFTPVMWTEVASFDPAATAWATVVSVRDRPRGRCDVTLSVDAEKYARLTAALTRKQDIVLAISNAFFEEGRALEEERHMRGEVEHALRDPDGSEPDPNTIDVEWTLAQAYNVVSAIDGLPEGCPAIRLTRFGAQGRDSVGVAVSLPVDLFEAAMGKCAQEQPDVRLADCLAEVIIRACAKGDPRENGAEVPDYIPF